MTHPTHSSVTDGGPEERALDWLQERCVHWYGEHQNDVSSFGVDEMVEAYMAGLEAAPSAQPVQGEPVGNQSPLADLLDSCIADIGTDEPFVVDARVEDLGPRHGIALGSCTQLSAWLLVNKDHPSVQRLLNSERVAFHSGATSAPDNGDKGGENTAEAPTPDGEGDLVEIIKTRLLGVHPDDQDVQLEDEDWEQILTALSAKRDDELWGALEKRFNWELSFDVWEDNVWQVHKVTGSRNDREWSLIGIGETPQDALRQALASTKQGGE
jgi:hypothetical protein